tara:strand:- start:259 stop:1140 length:882 start_codon:yes stop_codon:yes gene_type:complete
MSSSSEGGPAGISVSPFLKGQQQEDLLSALAGQQAALESSAQSMQGAAGRVGSGIRRATAAANVLEQAQLARQAGRAAQGMAAGGGAAQASGSIAAQGMRERMAAAAASEAQATQAELGAMQAYNDLRERAAQGKSELVSKKGEIAKGQQQAVAAFNQEVNQFVNEYESGQVNEEQAAQNISNLVGALDVNDPTQRGVAKSAFKQLWMMATENPADMPSDVVLEALMSSGMPISQLFASWTGSTDSNNRDAFWNMARQFYNSNRPEGAQVIAVNEPDVIEGFIASMGQSQVPE